MRLFKNFFIVLFLLFPVVALGADGGFDLSSIFEMIAEKWPMAGTIITGLACLPVLAQVFVFITPSKSDNKKLKDFRKKPIVSTIWDVLLSFAPLQKKKGKIKLSRDED